MSREATTGRGGVFSHFGPRTTNDGFAGTVSAGGRKKQLVCQFQYDSLPGGAGGTTDAAMGYIPAGSTIVEAWLTVDEDFTGSSGIFDIGLEQSDGTTAIDVDGFYDNLLLADIADARSTDLESSKYTTAGTLVGGYPLEVDGYLKATLVSGTFTAGKATITVEYVAPHGRYSID